MAFVVVISNNRHKIHPKKCFGGHVSASAKCCDSVCAGEAEVALLGSWARCSVAAAVAGL